MQAVRHIVQHLRRRTLDDDVHACAAGPCLLPLLQPVRFCLHPFLSARDAARLMQTSRSLAASLLCDYAFVDHVFFVSQVHWMDAVKRSLAFHARYGTRIIRMCLPKEWNEPLVDVDSRRAVLPRSLLALSLGRDFPRGKPILVNAALDGPEWQSDGEKGNSGGELARLERRLQHWENIRSRDTWSELEFASCKGSYNQPIPPGALPHGLRFLQFSWWFDQPLQVGSIPNTVEVLQFGFAFNRPLLPGHLPASLTHLVIDHYYNQPLLPGVLPAGLRQLHLGNSYNQPLLPGTLPAQLQRLRFSFEYNQPIAPGTIPSSVTHLRLSESFVQWLQPGTIPHGVVHLNLGDRYDHPLPPGVLPASLRELVMSREFNQALQPGSLPDGLEVLLFPPSAKFQHVLQPGVIPASVRVLRLGMTYRQGLLRGGVPATVKSLRLPPEYRRTDLTGVLSPLTRVVWWTRED